MRVADRRAENRSFSTYITASGHISYPPLINFLLYFNPKGSKRQKEDGFGRIASSPEIQSTIDKNLSAS
jgi:hypothetical protein